MSMAIRAIDHRSDDDEYCESRRRVSSPKVWKLGSTPEETIRLTLDSIGMSVEEFAIQGLLQRSYFERVVAGIEPITLGIIEGLERVVGKDWPYFSEVELDELDDWSNWDEC